MKTAGLLLLGLLCGCAPSSKIELERSGAVQAFDYAENYQEIFRRVSQSARACLASDLPLAHGRLVVDAALYSELGFGEVSYYLQHVAPQHYFAAKIEKKGSGARLTLRAAANDRLKRQVDLWARGASECG